MLLAYVLFVVEHAVISSLLGRLPAWPGLLVGALANLLGWLLVLIGVLVFVRVILGFVGSDSRHPVVPLVIQLTEPLLAPVRRRLPTPGGLDFSPMLVILAILLLRALVVHPLADLGASLA